MSHQTALSILELFFLEYIKKEYRSKLCWEDGILRDDITQHTTREVADFYQTSPFPNYQGFENKASLTRVIFENQFLNDLKNHIGLNKKIVEVGSGTSQLSLALATGTNNFVLAMDPTIHSLKIGRDFARKNNINNVVFLNADLFADPIENGFFDVVWCSGVLHHTSDPEKGFEIISEWVIDDGLIIIGLYNSFGRLRTNIRQIIFRLFGKSNFAKRIVSKMDPYLRRELSAEKKQAWWRDQYEHPIETKFTIEDVMRWFDQNNVEFLGSIPCATFESDLKSIKDMRGDRGTYVTRLYAQLGMVFSTSAEGGLFITIGQKKKQRRN